MRLTSPARKVHIFVTISLLTFLPFYVRIYMKVEGKQRKTRKAVSMDAKTLVAKFKFARNILGLSVEQAVKAALDPDFIQISGNIFFDDSDEEDE